MPRKTRKDARIRVIEEREGIIFRNKDGRKTRKDKLVESVRKEVKKKFKK